MSKLGNIVRLMPSMLSLPLEMAEAALSTVDGLEAYLLTLANGVEHTRDVFAASRTRNRLTVDQLADPAIDLDRMIEELLEAEQTLAEERKTMAYVANKFRTAIGRKEPALRPLAKRIGRAIDEICVDALEALRDQRWDAMAVRADRQPRDADGTAIETPEQFDEWLAELNRPE